MGYDRAHHGGVMNVERGFTGLLLISCVGLGALVLLLSGENRALRTQLAARATIAPLQPGDRLAIPTLDEAARAHRQTLPAGSSHRTLVLVFAHGCGPCEATMPIWREMLAVCPPSRLHVVGLSVGEPDGRPPAVEERPAFPVRALTASERGGLLGRLPSLPASIILDESGTVESVWFGELSMDEQALLRDEICASG